MASFWFSPDGKEYHITRENFEMFDNPNVILNSSNEKAGGDKNSISICISLQSKVGKFVKIELKPRSTWLLLSEITFETGNTGFYCILQKNVLKIIRMYHYSFKTFEIFL